MIEYDDNDLPAPIKSNWAASVKEELMWKQRIGLKNWGKDRPTCVACQRDPVVALYNDKDLKPVYSKFCTQCFHVMEASDARASASHGIRVDMMANGVPVTHGRTYADDMDENQLIIPHAAEKVS